MSEEERRERHRQNYMHVQVRLLHAAHRTVLAHGLLQACVLAFMQHVQLLHLGICSPLGSPRPPAQVPAA
jgi:hypothetical protein